MNTLPLSRLISTSVNLAAQAAQAPNTSSLLILGGSDHVNVAERMLEYTSLAEMLSDGFLSTDPEYLSAQAWFSQLPQPNSVLIGRWAKTATHGHLICGPMTAAEQALSSWTVITNGSFHIAIDGAAALSVTGVDFHTATTMAAVAALLDTSVAGATVSWDSYDQCLVFTSEGTAGSTSTVGLITAGTGGTDLSAKLKGTAALGAYVADGLAAEAAEAAVAIFDSRFGQQWYGLVLPEASSSEHLLVAAYVEAATTKHFYGVTTQDANSLVAAATSDVGYLLKAGHYNKTCVQYSSSSAYAVASLLGRILTTNYSANQSVITLMFKQEPGVTAEQLTTAQANALSDKNINVFVAYNNNTSIIQYGTCASGQYIDTVVGTDWLATELQTGLYNQLYTSSTKTPQTDAGVNTLQSVIEGICYQAVLNGLLAPGLWNQAGFGGLAQGDFVPKGYYIYSTPVSQQSLADRAARKAPVFQIAAKLAGAVHTADIIINVNP